MGQMTDNEKMEKEIAELRDALKREKQRTALTARSQQRLDDVREREIEELRDKIETSRRTISSIAESVALLATYYDSVTVHWSLTK